MKSVQLLTLLTLYSFLAIQGSAIFARGPSAPAVESAALESNGYYSTQNVEAHPPAPAGAQEFGTEGYSFAPGGPVFYQPKTTWMWGPPPPVLRGPPPPMTVDETEPRETHATVTCPYPDGRCFHINAGSAHPSHITVAKAPPPPKIEENEPTPTVSSAPPTTVAACYGAELARVAKARTARRFTGFGGYCAQYVDRDLSAAGIGSAAMVHPPVEADAVAWWRYPGHTYGVLDQMGFTNEVGRYNEINAPTGAVLVFEGPNTPSYEATGHYPPRNLRKRKSAGDWLGHITIKSTPGDGYLTDGHTAHAAALPSPARKLVGVYVLNHCKTCKTALKAKCGDN